MLPKDLTGPALAIGFAEADAREFLRRNSHMYPRLDPDFILQICYEHPGRLNELLPGFDAGLHSATRISRSAGWIRDNVKYDDGEEPTFWSDQFDCFLCDPSPGYSVFVSMTRDETWSFPPVIVLSRFAATLGAPSYIGEPYHLIEGTHRISYLRRMLELGMLADSSTHVLILVAEG